MIIDHEYDAAGNDEWDDNTLKNVAENQNINNPG